MTDLEVFRLSAKACGNSIDAKWPDSTRVYIFGSFREWNPFTNDSQRWECVKKLLETGFNIDFTPYREMFKQSVFDNGTIGTINIDCPAEEFPARALAELESRKTTK